VTSGPAGFVVRAAHYPGRAPIEAYGNGGFRFVGMSHRGSLLCLPSGIYGWNFPSPLDDSSLDPVLAESADIEILLVGTGPEIAMLPEPLRARLREAGIGTETMSTGAAVRTFNVLLAEGRAVAAALMAVD
jgi:uncharacterized protein